MNLQKLEDKLLQSAPPQVNPPESHRHALEEHLRSTMSSLSRPQPLTPAGYLALAFGVLAACMVICFGLPSSQNSIRISYPVFTGTELTIETRPTISLAPLSYRNQSASPGAMPQVLYQHNQLIEELDN